MKPSADPHQDLNHARQAARECHRVAEQLVEYADRLSNVIGPAEIAEYANLLTRDAAALSARVEAFDRLGLGIASIEGTDMADGD
ncbi:hypothetical protein [Hamadaea tsunoensis]|uniref:hypothetical protein n=1 Tax=Hamadaea tsunoensis TaxID=53368 RepID=UPI0004025BD9|nr:hypothetical protein [Hamadaea tsunoensis]